MPDVSRSDSQRSDTSTSLRPRVSFNRDVHVKRIVSRDSPHVTGALSGDGAGHLVALPVRKERLAGRSKKALAEEAAKVLHQVDKVDCTANNSGIQPEKFYTLPARRKHRRNNTESPHSSQERINTVRRRSEELGVTAATPPKKPPRTFAATNKPHKQKNSLFKLFSKSDKETEPKKSNLRRSVSDASNLKSNSFEKLRKRTASESDDNQNNSTTKKTQLSPIIEVSTTREDYFTPNKDYLSDKENVNESFEEKDVKINLKPPRRKWDKSRSPDSRKELKEKNEKVKLDVPEVVIIDVEKAESISQTKRPKKLSSHSFKDKFKFLSLNKDHKKQKLAEQSKSKVKSVDVNETDEVDNINLESLKSDISQLSEGKTCPKIQETIKILEESFEKNPEMIHSSQQPVEKIPLTRGHAVDNMIRRLNRDKFSPPPKTNTILVTPTVTVSHNNNQPFSYTQPRDMSPERPYSRSKSPPFDKPSSPIIYAQVVVGNGDPDTPGNKQTIHTAYKKQFQHSDSDEGLGYEENSFNRKYTQFGDEKKHDIDKFDEEYPITPKFKSNGFSNSYDYNEFSKTEHHFVDSSARGRGDGMDSRRRESLTEPHLIENGITTPNGKSDLSYRRDLLESRINSRRLGEKHLILNDSPEFPSKSYNPRVNKFVSETTSRYYRHGSTSPVGFTENYTSETKIDRNGEKHFTENRSKTVLNDRNNKKYPEIQDDYDYRNRFDRYEAEPKSLESQASDYRSSPENGGNRKSYYTNHETKDYRSLHHNRYKSKGDKTLLKDRDHYKSNPEINRRTTESSYKYDDHNRFASETYHDSLRRQKHDTRRDDSTKHSEKYFDERERKDKFGDSGIENDFRRDSGENVRVTRSYNQNYRSNNESEDEGFASSLLIASERQHTEDNITNANKKHRKDYDSDKEIRGYGRKEETNKKNGKHEFVHRERSIDDGSHYDPRIDKDLDEKRGTLKVDKKPPKPAKISSLKKVKQLFTRDSNKKSKKEKVDPPRMVREESLRARYKEYRGSSETLNRNTIRRDVHSDRERSDRERRDHYQDSKHDSSFDSRREYSDSRADNSDNSQTYDYSNRRRMSTPSPSPTRETRESRDLRDRDSRDTRDSPPNNTQSVKHDSWFKSLDRFSLKKKQSEKTANKEPIKAQSPKPPVSKNLRFFGDTDLESDTSVRRKSSLKSRPTLPSYKSSSSTKSRSQSTRNLHNISEEHNNSDADTLRKYKSYKSMQNISEPDRDVKGSRSNLKPPISPNRRMDTLKSESRKTESRNRKRRNEISSVESSTEGDSSQQSQRSVVYLHAATVGDIPGPGYLARNGRRAASKEDLISNGSSRMQTQSKTLSRSFSVLAPWRPKHPSEGYDIDYSQQSLKPVKTIRNGSSKGGGKTAKEISNQKKMSNQNLSTLSRKSKSKENLSQTLNRRKDEPIKSSTTTLYKKKDRNAKDNMRYSKDDKKISSKSMSVESLGGERNTTRSKDDAKVISRSVSMPRDPDKSAGWFKMNKKNSKRTVSTQRL